MFHSTSVLPGSFVCHVDIALERSKFLGCGLASRSNQEQSAGKLQPRTVTPVRAETVTFKGKTRVNLTLKKDHPQEQLPRYLADIDRLFYLVFPDRKMSKPLRTQGDRRKWRISLDQYQVLFWKVRPHVDIEVWRDPQDDPSGLPVMRLMATSCDLGRDLLPLLQAAHFKLDVDGKLYSTTTPITLHPNGHKQMKDATALGAASSSTGKAHSNLAIGKDLGGGRQTSHQVPSPSPPRGAAASSTPSPKPAAHAKDSHGLNGRTANGADARNAGHGSQTGALHHLPPRRNIQVDVDVQVQLKKIPAFGLIPTDGLVLVGDTMVSAVLNAMERTLNEETLLANYLDYCRTHQGAHHGHAQHKPGLGSAGGEAANGVAGGLDKAGVEGKARLHG